jgi:putative SOS response-associated peptidase YedK
VGPSSRVVEAERQAAEARGVSARHVQCPLRNGGQQADVSVSDEGRRCLVPFMEFHERDHYFGTGEPMAFAGLWESWRGEDSDILTVTFLTTEPNAEVASVGHDRMPVLLATVGDRRRWLVDGPNDEMLRPFPDGVLAIRPKD